ncbi:FAD-dependent monooxygenase [Devosia sp. SL43]|uniref:FAD-dependent monooxygenase n=1 Tax=Devosia sp. SL43 TaxID=2806348 RepID=UPI001F008A0C|nr:FAD-dependent monooxygenase [Devosia sp. SL43]UJW86459.1 FAD-dependent monooxygenase [Devosia sp. SL43]
MSVSGQIFYVAGAGVSGLTLALALARSGATVIVLERNSVISEFGAGLQISPNARRVLDRLGLDEAIAARSLEPEGIDIYPFGRRSPLVTLTLGQTMRDRFGAPYAVMHRADLVDALYKATRRFANIDILFGVRSWDAVSHANGVTISIDEADGQTRTSRARALVGADGVHSQTRRTLLDGPQAQYQKRVAWRTLLPFDSVAGELALDRVSVLFASGCHIVCYPLPHRRQVNIALFAKAARHTETGTAPTLPSALAESRRIGTILAAAGQTWTPWPLFTVDAPSWHKGNIGLVGDAAHAMVPFQAQGAAMGIEDAAVLAPLLVNESSPETAFARFEAIRRARVTHVAQTALSNGRAFHMAWPFSAARDLVISAQGSEGHLKRLEWLYGHDTSQPTP